MKRKKLALLVATFCCIHSAVAQSNSFPSKGNVGLGIKRPVEKLQVNGKVFLNGTDRNQEGKVISNFYWSGSSLEMGTRPGDTSLTSIVIKPGGASGKTVGSSFSLYTIKSGEEPQAKVLLNSEGVSLFNGGNVGIGTDDPRTELSVAGTITATKVKVIQKLWPDYVFHEHYNLPSVYEVEEFILQNRHLPGIPSARKVQAEGLDLGEINSKLLQKIEEQMLYIIQQQKSIDSLQKQINDIKERLN